MKTSFFAPSPWQKRISLGFGIFCVVFLLTALGLMLFAVEDPAAIVQTKLEAFLTSIILVLLATLLTYRRPENIIGWLLAVAAILRMSNFLEIFLAALWSEQNQLTPAYILAANLFDYMSGLTYTLIAFIFILFPDGKLPSRRWRPVYLLLGIQIMLTAGLMIFIGADLFRHFSAAEAAGQAVQLVPVTEFGPLSRALHVRELQGVNAVIVILALIALLVVVLGLAAQVLRFRSGSYIQRQQIKWVIFAMVIWVGLIPILFIPLPIPQEILVLGFLPVPISVTVAIFRYRLYEIDIIINRTLVYGSLSAALLGVYFASVVVFETLSRNLTGDRSPLATVLATLIIAAIFQPLRRRLQALIDRAFFRSKYDAQQTLESFAGFVRDEVSMDRLTEALMGTVHETLQPTRLLLMIDAQQEETTDFLKKPRD